MLITVSKNGNEGYTSLQEALDSIPQGHPSEVTIRIKPGIYEEKITVDKAAPPILLLGKTPIPPSSPGLTMPIRWARTESRWAPSGPAP